MSLAITTEPTVEPITLLAAKMHLRVDGYDEDSLITDLIVAARKYVEQITWLQLITATYRLKMDSLPVGEVILPRPPLSSVTSFTYVDGDGASQTLATTEYTTDTANFPGRIVPAYAESWPSTLGHINDVTIVYVAGFGLAVSVPGPIKQAILVMIGHLYANRNGCAEVPMTVDCLLGPYCVRDTRALRWL